MTPTPTPGWAASDDVPTPSTQETDMTVFKQAHQGDVFLRRIAALPADAQPVPVPRSGRVTLALGETSGHHHSFPHRARVALFRDTAGASFLRVDAPAVLEHANAANAPTGEHGPINVMSGIYALPPQMQWSDEREPIRVED